MQKLKTTVIAWVSIYPAITLILVAFGDALNELPIVYRTLVLTLILVPLMTYVLVPFWTKVLSRLGYVKLHIEGKYLSFFDRKC